MDYKHIRCPQCRNWLGKGARHRGDCAWERENKAREEARTRQSLSAVLDVSATDTSSSPVSGQALPEQPGALSVTPINPETELYSSPLAPASLAAATAGSGLSTAGLSAGGAATVANASQGAAHTVKRATAAQKHLEYIEKLDRRILTKHSKILEMVPLAAEIDNSSPKPEGWTDKQYRIALDARNGSREAPMYLGVAQKVVDSYKRVAALSDRDPAPTLNCDIQVFVQQNVYQYDVLETEESKK